MRQLTGIFLFVNLFLSGIATNAQTVTPSGSPKQIPGTKNAHEEAPMNSLLPPFHFVTANETFLTEADIPKGKPVVLALFNPTCDHCMRAAMAMREKIEAMRNVTIIFVTSVTNYGDLKTFAQSVDVAKYPNFYVCATQDTYITKTFMPNWILPQIMIYNSDRKLKKIFYETVNTDSVMHYLYK